MAPVSFIVNQSGLGTVMMGNTESTTQSNVMPKPESAAIRAEVAGMTGGRPHAEAFRQR